MSHNLNEVRPIGGLNMDDGARVIPPTDYAYAKNIRNAITAINRGGSVTNIKGNLAPSKYTLPYNANVFPTGTNKVIGSVEDTKYSTVLFFVWNSTGKHQILRYYRNLTSPANPYGEVQQIIQYDFGWTKHTEINSGNIVYGVTETGEDDEETGDLLYWCDPEPKKINLTKANVCVKQKSWDLFLPITCDLAPIPVFTFKNFAGGTIYSVGELLSDPTDRQTIITDIAAGLNSNVDSPVTAEACDCRLVLTEKVAGTVWTIETDSDQILISPNNWYGGTLIDRFFDRCKWQPLNAPQATFEKDLNYEPNYVQRKVFQFRLEYDYDDLERSALGVWSQIPINNLGCDGTSDKSYNYIDVDFNDTLIPLATTLVLLKRIRFIARELNTGADRAVISLEPCDFLDYRDGAWYVHFTFYNDIISSPIDAATAAKLFDNVPLESNDERFVKNRIVEGGILEGYNAPDCIEAKAQMEFSETPNPTLYRVKFYVRVLTYGLSDAEQAGASFYDAFPTQRKYPFWNPSYTIVRGGVFHDTGTEDTFAFFGGGGFGRGAGGDFGITSGMDTTYDQRCPEGGFPVYLAGTQYFGVSRQVNVGLATDSKGALDISTSDRIDDIGSYLYGTSNDGGDLYSEVTLLVPAGEYVARVASHWCSFGDKLEKGFCYDLSAGTAYQKTSTNVWGTVGANGFPLNTWNKTKEIKFTVTNADIDDAGTFVILDLAPPHDYDQDPAVCRWQPINCYLYDDNGNTDVNSDSFIGVPVEKTVVSYELGLAGDWSGSAFTDHNGYWFGIQGLNLTGYFPMNGYQVNTVNIQSGTLINVGSLSDLFNKTLRPENFALVVPTQVGTGTPVSLIAGVVATTNTAGRDNCSTRITGHVVDSNGNDIGDVSIIYEVGAVTTSRADGTFTLIAWGDMITVNIPNTLNPIASILTPNDNRIVDNLIYAGKFSCLPTYPNGQEQSPILIDPFGSAANEYNPDNPYVAADFIVDENNNPAVKAHKRGGNYIYGIRAYDNSGRLCSVVSVVEMYVPFITEDIGNYSIEDFSGNIYPAGTYQYGKPTIRLVLAPTTTFDSWVSSIQWMRPKNSIYGRYLQWVANQVTYVAALATTSTPEILTSFQSGDATAIKISIKNIVDYSAQNNDSQVGYSYQAGDRVRLIADRNIQYIDGLNDFEVTSYDSATQEIIIKPESFSSEIKSGSLFEIFNPKSVATEDQQIFYEVGEVIKVNNGIPENYTITLSNGDTYWHGRTITVADEQTGYAGAYPVVIEDASVSDFYPSLAQDIGRIGTIDPAFKQVYAPTKMRCSNPFLPSTAINGLSSFEELNQVELDRSNGQIERLLQKENTVIAVTSLREISTYIEVVSFQQADTGSGVLAIANQYFGTQYPHAKRLGTDLPSTVLINDGQAFGLQSKRGEVWRYQGDGEVSISDAKMINYFKQLEQDGVSKAHAFYDRFHKEYGITLWREYQEQTTLTVIGSSTFTVPISGPLVGEEVTVQYLANGTWTNATGTVASVATGITRITVFGVTFTLNQQVNIVYSLPETVVWFNGDNGVTKDRWCRFDDRTPERWEQCGSELVSFKNGRIWLENVNPLYNNFYGIQYNSKITPVFNQNPDNIKVFNALWLSQQQADNGCDWFSDSITNTIGQLSRLNKNNWRKREQDFYIDLKRDLTVSSVTNPIINGRRLRATDLSVEMTNDGTGEFSLYSFRMNWTASARTEK